MLRRISVLFIAGLAGGCYEGIDGAAEGGEADDTEGGAATEGEADDTEGSDESGGEAEHACETATPSAVVRMLNRREYRNTLRDLLGIDEAAANLAVESIPADAVVGFDNNAESLVASATHVEQQLAIAESLAASTSLASVLDCDPNAPDDEATCVDAFVTSFGLRAFRRPVDDDERALFTGLFDGARADGRTFAEAIRLVLQAFLQSPQFLYRAEGSATVDGGEVRVDGWELASRLSYFLWGSMPDDELFAAAEQGELETATQVEAHARRLLEDPRARATTASFHRQWLELYALDQITKEGSAEDVFDTLKPAMLAETEAFVDHVFWEGTGQLDQLLVSDTIVLNWDVADLYGIDGDYGGVFTPSPATDERFGLLTQASILSRTSNPDRTSPTRRGRFMRQQLLCQSPPPPPAGVPDLPDASGTDQTIREMLDQHTSDPACSGCHVLLDPLGFGLEQYDLVGVFRTQDNGTAIDASGEIVGVDDLAEPEFEGARELSEKLAGSAVFEDCVAQQWFRFAMGRDPQDEDECTLDRLREAIDETDGSMPELLVAIATSHAFSHLATEEAP